MILPYVLILIIGNTSVTTIPFQSLSLCEEAGHRFISSAPAAREYHCVIRK